MASSGSSALHPACLMKPGGWAFVFLAVGATATLNRGDPRYAWSVNALSVYAAD